VPTVATGADLVVAWSRGVRLPQPPLCLTRPLAQLLLDHGASVFVEDVDRATPLALAKAAGNTGCTLLLERATAAATEQHQANPPGGSALMTGEDGDEGDLSFEGEGDDAGRVMSDGGLHGHGIHSLGSRHLDKESV